MALLSLQNLELAFGHVALLDACDFSLETNERVGMIGRNGTGKSSLLKIIAGVQHADDGTIAQQNGTVLAYVAQEPLFDADATVHHTIAQGLGDAGLLLEEYEILSLKIAEASDAEINRWHELEGELTRRNAWNVGNQISAILSQFGLNGDDKIGALSGGFKKRVALAQALVRQPDILLLDEPTNHLDIASINWLEDLLKKFSGSILFITHDRSFLDAVSTRIVELDRGKLLSFPGNFTAYQTRKAEQLEIENIERAKFDKVLAQEEVWIRQGIKARRTRNEGRVRRLEALRNVRAARREVAGQVKLDVSLGERSGKLVAELSNVSKGYGGNNIVDDFSSVILRGDKIGIIGNNGTGKTTLLKLILGEHGADTGTVRLGTNLQVAYFDQMRAKLDLNATLADTISPGSEWVEIGNNKKHVMSYLGDFLFAPERAHSPVKSLSGGERNRLLLARLFAKPSNVLVLDEPTNDLDIDTLELLEDLLQDYAGTVFLVSHDRTFLDNVVTQVIVSQGAGKWMEMVGGYSDWERWQAEYGARSNRANSNSTPAENSNKTKNEAKAPITAKPKKLSYKEERELAALPKEINELEIEQKHLQALLADPEFYQKDKAQIAQVNTRFAEIEELLLEKLQRWEALEAA